MSNKCKKIELRVIVGLMLAWILTGCNNENSNYETVEPKGKEIASQFDPGDYRFPREEGTTKGGYPVTLSGKPITKEPLILNSDEKKVKDYPEYYVPGDETLAANEMRITIMGSGIPAPIRPAQATSCVLVQLGNGDAFIFDIGSDNVGKLYSMGLHPSELDKVFITHLHLDHVGGIFPLFDAMGWARNSPLRVWGPSGHTPELGTKAFTQNVRRAAEWHTQSKQEKLPIGGAEFDTTEIDVDLFSPANPRQLVYDYDGVKVYAFPIVHSLNGPIGYKLKWNGLSMSFVSDSEVSTFEAEQSIGVDVLIHEVMPSAEAFAKGNKMPIEDARSVISRHTTPQKLGYLLGVTNPRLGIGTHFKLGDETNDALFESLRKTYKGPFLLAQDLTTISITHDFILMRQTKINSLGDPPASKSQNTQSMTTGGPSGAIIPNWLKKTVVQVE